MTMDNYIDARTLIVYVNDSHYKYYNLFVDHLYEISDSNLIVYSRDSSSGEEKTIACFRTWDYFIID